MECLCLYDDDDDVCVLVYVGDGDDENANVTVRVVQSSLATVLSNQPIEHTHALFHCSGHVIFIIQM